MPRDSEKPRCLEVFDKGLVTSKDFCKGMGALMADLADRRLDAEEGNAICHAGAQILHALKLQIAHGKKSDNGDTVLKLQ